MSCLCKETAACSLQGNGETRWGCTSLIRPAPAVLDQIFPRIIPPDYLHDRGLVTSWLLLAAAIVLSMSDSWRRADC